MLIEFSVKNFRSFKDLTTISLVAESLKDDSQTYEIRNNTNLLPVAGIFGPNASGKSNLIKAMAFLQGSVTNPNALHFPSTEHPLLKPYLLNKASQKKPSFFEIVLWDKPNSKEYRYGFEISEKRIESEWLELTEKANSNFVSSMVFERKGSSFTLGAKSKKNLQPLVDRVLPTAHAVNIFAQFAHEPSLNFIQMVQNMMVLEGNTEAMNLSLDRLADDKDFRKKVLTFLQDADISLKDISVEKKKMTPDQIPGLSIQIPDGATQLNLTSFKISTAHAMQDSEGEFATFDLAEQESLGTRMLAGYAGMLLQALEKGSLVLIDEFASSMHPLLSSCMLNLVRDTKSNKMGTQLLFATHDTYLLSDEVGLRRDEIWFTEKNEKEESVLMSLSEYKTRADLNIQKNYLRGRFGAVPITGAK